ncbi:MAG TPA: hypothetical protein VFA70_02620, partial [Dehalococcoidia bacterium]|nr:hypothetical protein [Dehalococcoidia bacterium]
QDPSALLISPRMHELMASLRSSADLVIYDSHTSGTAAEVTALAAGADAILTVVHAGRTRRRALLATIDELRRSQRPILGAVLNLVSNNRWPSILGEPREPIPLVSLPPPPAPAPDFAGEPFTSPPTERPALGTLGERVASRSGLREMADPS